MGREITSSNKTINTVPLGETVYSFQICLAMKNIQIECLYKHTIKMCKDYLAKFDNPDIMIRVTPEDLMKEIDVPTIFRLPSINIKNEYVGVSLNYTNSEMITIYRRIADSMVKYNTILLHGAAIAVDDKCYVFIAPSGTGKTTHIRNWLKMIPRSIVINGDKPLINVDDGLVYGTPWCGKENMNTNTSAPLAGLIVLKRGKINRIQKTEFCDVLPALLAQTYVPLESKIALDVLRLIGRLQNVPCFIMECNMEESSALIAYNGLLVSDL